MSDKPVPGRQHLSNLEVLEAMKSEAEYYFGRTPGQVLVLSLTAGMFITLGALFSILLSDGVTTPGIQVLLQGLGFSTGFFMVVLSRAALFTEANVILPVSLLQSGALDHFSVAIRFWLIAFIGNMLGAIILGQVIAFAQTYPESVSQGLQKVVAKKMAYHDEGTVLAWFKIVASGMLGNGLIGMAAFFATMGRTLIGKFVPVFLVVTLFVAGNLQHSPANMGYFSLASAMGSGPDWVEALTWSILPAAIGNILGGGLLVALPFWYALSNRRKT